VPQVTRNGNGWGLVCSFLAYEELTDDNYLFSVLGLSHIGDVDMLTNNRLWCCRQYANTPPSNCPLVGGRRR